MTERLRPEGETSRRQLVHDELFTYAGYWSQDGICRIRILTAPDQVPVVVATELTEENRGTSITNAAEYIAAEIVARHLPERFEAEVPVIWIEEYPRTPQQRSRGISAFSQAEFSSFTPRVEYLGGIKRIRIGRPTWRHVDESAVEALIGPIAAE